MENRVARPVEFAAVEVVRLDRFIAMCRIGTRLVAVPTRRMLPGTEVARVGDRGRLIIGRELALNLGLM